MLSAWQQQLLASGPKPSRVYTPAPRKEIKRAGIGTAPGPFSVIRGYASGGSAIALRYASPFAVGSKRSASGS